MLERDKRISKDQVGPIDISAFDAAVAELQGSGLVVVSLVEYAQALRCVREKLEINGVLDPKEINLTVPSELAGVGKTRVARFFAQIVDSLGYSRLLPQSLVSEYIGQTSEPSLANIESALGGFIDTGERDLGD